MISCSQVVKILLLSIFSTLIICIFGTTNVSFCDDQYAVINSTKKTQLLNIFGNLKKMPNSTKDIPDLSPVVFIDVSPDNKKMLSSHYSNKGTIRLWDTSNAGLIGNFEGHSREVNSVNFSPDGTTFVSSSHDGTVRVWNVLSGQLVKIVKKVDAEYKLVWSALYIPDGKNILVSTYEKPKLQLVDVDSGLLIRTYDSDLSVRKISIANNADIFLAISSYDSPTTWNIKTGRKIEEFKREKGFWSYIFSSSGAYVCGGISRDAKYVATGSTDGWLRTWETNSGKEMWGVKAHKDGTTELAFSPNGLFVLSAGKDATIKIWNTKSGEFIDQINLNDIVTSLAFSPDSSSFFAGTMSGIILHFGLK